MEKIYKAVSIRPDGTYGSVAAPDGLAVDYKIGEWTTAKVGRLFAFSEPEPATRWWPGFNWIVILEGYGIDPVHLTQVPDIFSVPPKTEKLFDFWLDPEGYPFKKVEVSSSVVFPIAFKPLRIYATFRGRGLGKGWLLLDKDFNILRELDSPEEAYEVARPPFIIEDPNGVQLHI